MRRVVRLPALATEQANPAESSRDAATTAKNWRVICLVMSWHQPGRRLTLHRSASFLLFTIAILGCTAPSAPSYFSAEFVLTDVDGQHLPVNSTSSSRTLPLTIVAGHMALDESGGAYISEDRIDGQSRYSLTTPYSFRVKGTSIRFDYADPPCPLGEPCPAPPTGTILDNGLDVQIVFPPTSAFQVYTFRVVPRIN